MVSGRTFMENHIGSLHCKDNPKGWKRDANGKAELRRQLLLDTNQPGSAATPQELKDLLELQRAGHRRRRRLLNDKALRCLSEPLAAEEMEALFSPPPWGTTAPLSAFTTLQLPENSPTCKLLWNADMDKEKAFIAMLAEPRLPRTPRSWQSSAVRKWTAVRKSARLALKSVSVDVVTELEQEVLARCQQGPEGAWLEVHLPDSFARLIVYGIADFHGLAAKGSKAASSVALLCAPCAADAGQSLRCATVVSLLRQQDA